MPGERPGEHGGAHQGQAGCQQPGLGGEQRGGDAGDADALERHGGERGGGQRARGEPEAAQRAQATRATGQSRSRRYERGQPLGGNARKQVGGREAVAHGGACQATAGR